MSPGDRPPSITPADVENRSFALAHPGYDRDQVRAFLVEVATVLRAALRTDASHADAGREATRIIRAAHVTAAIRHEEADALADAIIEGARQEAAQLREAADADAGMLREQARRVLAAAQEQSEAIVADAEARARRVLTGARQDALNHAQQVSKSLDARAGEVVEAEQGALRRLNDARQALAALIDALAGAEPVLGPTVEILQLALDARTAGEPARAEHAEDAARMVRAAVERARDAAAGAAADL